MGEVRIPFILRLLYTSPSCEISVLRDNVILISFSERVIDFSETDIEITGGTLSDFRGNGTQFLIDVQTEATAEISVAAGVCQSANGIPNTASNRFIYEG